MRQSAKTRSLFALLLAGGALAMAPAAAGAAKGEVLKHDVAESPSEALSYWTPERMEAAEPLGTPPGPEGAPATATTSSIPPDLETDPTLDAVYPQRIHGILFFKTGGQDASCSATVVTSVLRNLILTAGHCVATPSSSGPVFSTNIIFVPGYRNGAMPFGAYAASTFRTPVLWSFEGLIELDVASINLASGATGLIQDVLGSRGVRFNIPDKKYRGMAIQIFGYPAQPAPFYDGERLILCNASFQFFEPFTAAPVAGPCNQQQGSSGGGWVTAGGFVSSIVSHAGCQSTTGCTLISGTYFGDTAYDVYAKGGGVPKKTKKKLKKCKSIKKTGKRFNCKSKAQKFPAVPR